MLPRGWISPLSPPPSSSSPSYFTLSDSGGCVFLFSLSLLSFAAEEATAMIGGLLCVVILRIYSI